MTFVTRIELRSGNRAALQRVVEEVRATVERKGARLRGPHSDPPETLHVPLFKSLAGDDHGRFPSWEYTVYARRMEVVGHDDAARSVAAIEFPESVHVEVELERTGRPV